MQLSGDLLLTLQEVDERLTKKQQELDQLNAELEGQAEIPVLTERVEHERETSIERRAHLARLEVDADAQRERVEELEERIYGGTVTNLRELTAVEEEQTNARRELMQFEESLGPARLAAEDSERAKEELTTTLAERETTWAVSAPKLRRQSRAAAKEVAVLEQERAEVSKNVPADELTLYDQLLFRRHGVAIARVERGVCLACHITLPLKEASRLRRSDAIVTCGNCGRILIPS
jgi:predicted  nucleic acid-binding Zn-ribbon protein